MRLARDLCLMHTKPYLHNSSVRVCQPKRAPLKTSFCKIHDRILLYTARHGMHHVLQKWMGVSFRISSPARP